MSIYPSNYTYLQPDAELIGRDLIKSMNYFGVLVIEFFVSRDKRLIANEMAPRVHNSDIGQSRDPISVNLNLM